MPERSDRFRLNLFLTVIAFLITVTGIFVTIIIYQRSKNIEVSAQVLASEELTLYTSEAELSARYTWAGEEVTHLWKLRINFVNSGDKTIVGAGDMRNILNDGLNFVFPSNTQILKIQKEDQNFTNTIVYTEKNQVQIQFPQWRSGEYIIASFYIASEEPLDENPFPKVSSRDIIDGDVVVQDISDRKTSEPLFFIDRSPRYLSIAGKIIGWITSLTLSVIFFGLFITGCISGIRLIKMAWWKSNYLKEFTEYLDKIKPPLTKNDKKYYTYFPYHLPEKLWDGFKGQKITIKEPITPFDEKEEAITIIIVSLILFIGNISIILMLIPA